MPRVNRRVRGLTQRKRSRAELLELLIGPNGKSVFRSESQKLEIWDLVCREISPEFAEQWFVAQPYPKPFSEIAEKYARDVVAGHVLSGEKVRLACARHLGDLEKQDKGHYRFDASKANRVCRFAELLPHVKGKWASTQDLILLQPWQIFILCCIFGWVKKSTGTRRFSLVYIEVGRKNAKSTLAAIIGDYMFCADGEFGAEVYSGATKEDQAMEVFRPALQMLRRRPELAHVLGIEIPSETSKKMRVGEDGSRFEVVVRAPGDGASPHCGIVDEYHEHDADTLFDTFRTGMGARQQPIQLVITTAGFNLAGPCKLLQADLCKVLEGLLVREEMFGIIYSIDPEDDWTSVAALIKANPNYGVSVFEDFLLSEQQAAIVTARKQGVFKTKHLCVWVGANAAYFNVQRWIGLADRGMKREQFMGLPCTVSVDLSTKRDITARILMFKKVVAGKDNYYLFSQFYIAGDQASRPEAQHYHGWVSEKAMISHTGAMIDFDAIQQETNEEIKQYRAREFAFDPWNAAQFAQGVAAGTRAVPVEIRQNVAMLSAPMKELDTLIAAGRIHHDGNPVMAWMMGNVVAHEDANENVYPRKEGDENKIDGAVAAIMALSRLMTVAPKQSVYARRGVLMVQMGSGVGVYA